MSADLRGILEAYSAVYDNNVKETLNSFHDEITDMDLSLISDRELSDIAEEALQELFEEGYSLFESEIILEDVIVEASSYMTAMMKGQNKYRRQQKRQEKIDRVKGAIKGALDTAKMKASSGAVKAYGAYRKAKQVADDKARRTAQTAKNVSAQTSRKASEAKAQVKSGLKGMIRKAAERVASGASKVAKRMTEGKDSSYLETDMKKRQKNNEKARKDMEKMGTPMKNPHFEEVSKIRKDWGDAYRSIYEKKMDPVGKEDGDIDNDGDKDSSDEYLMKRRKAIGKAMCKKEDLEQYVDFLIDEGYDCSELTWDDMYEEYTSLDEGLRSAVKRLLGKKDAPVEKKPESRGDQLRKKYNIGPERSDTSAKRQILDRTRAKAERDRKQYGGSVYTKSVADKSKAAHDRYLRGGYSKYGADDARGKGNKARRRAAALKKEDLDTFDIVFEILDEEIENVLEVMSQLTFDEVQEIAEGDLAAKARAKAVEMGRKRRSTKEYKQGGARGTGKNERAAYNLANKQNTPAADLGRQKEVDRSSGIGGHMKKALATKGKYNYRAVLDKRDPKKNPKHTANK